ncbi:MAG: sporulation inhibitor of replication protein SirA [Bacilli bacterium]
MRTYYIFNVNKYYSYMYKDNPFKMYKIFEEIYYSRDYDSVKTYHILEEIANPFNKIMLNEYIYFEYKLKYGYKRKDNIHYLSTTERTTLRINNYNIKLETESNYSVFFNDISNYNNNLFVCDFENMDYFWLSKLSSLQKDKLIVQ